jgi:hypothetical protein
MASKRKASAMAPAMEEPVDPSDELMFVCLGGGNEVGRSCHILQYKGKTVMVSYPLNDSAVKLLITFLQLDAGMHAGY